MANNNWTFKEIEILIDVYEKHYKNNKRVHRDTILDFPEELLKTRTKNACRSMANRLGLSGNKFWSNEDILILQEKYPKFGRNISELLNKGYKPHSIHQMARHLNLVVDFRLKYGITTEDYLKLLREKLVLERYSSQK